MKTGLSRKLQENHSEKVPDISQEGQERHSYMGIKQMASRLGNQAMLSLLGNPTEAHSEPMNAEPSIMRKGEARYQTSLEGIKMFNDSGLRERGYNGYAKGNEIHVEQNLPLEKKEDVILHEMGHVVQSGSDQANGNGLLYQSELEQQADRGFTAPANFTMPTSADGPVLGDVAEDMEYFQQYLQIREGIKNKGGGKDPFWAKQASEWKQHDAFFEKKNHVYESVNEEGEIGSIYFGMGNGDQGGRLRLVHRGGPEVSMHKRVKRFYGKKGNQIDFEKKGLEDVFGTKVYEEFYDENGKRVGKHTSRGHADEIIWKNSLKEDDYKNLLFAVEFAEIMTAPRRMKRNKEKIKELEAERERVEKDMEQYKRNMEEGEKEVEQYKRNMDYYMIFIAFYREKIRKCENRLDSIKHKIESLELKQKQEKERYDNFREIFSCLPEINESNLEKEAMEQVERANQFLVNIIEELGLKDKIPLNMKDFYGIECYEETEGVSRGERTLYCL